MSLCYFVGVLFLQAWLQREQSLPGEAASPGVMCSSRCKNQQHCHYVILFVICVLQAWLQREQSLLEEVANLRQEARLLLTLQTQQQQQQQRPAVAAAAAVPYAASSVAGPRLAASSSGSADAAYSDSPAAGRVCYI
jgi:hypothetical protein